MNFSDYNGTKVALRAYLVQITLTLQLFPTALYPLYVTCVKTVRHKAHRGR